MNDAPRMKSSVQTELSMYQARLETQLPNIPFDLTDYEGFNVGDLISDMFEDADGDRPILGMLVARAQDHPDLGQLPHEMFC